MQLLRTTPLSYLFPQGKQLHFDELIVSAGEMVSLKGPSGSGKSTFLHLLSGFLPLQNGKVEVIGKGALQPKKEASPDWRRKAVGFVPQRPFFWNSLTVEQNLQMSAWAKKTDTLDSALEICERLGLSSLLQNKPSELSTGELQRLSIVRSTLGNAPIVLADEPTSSLDDINASKVLSLFHDLALEGKGIVFATHDSRASVASHRTVLMDSLIL